MEEERDEEEGEGIPLGRSVPSPPSVNTPKALKKLSANSNEF